MIGGVFWLPVRARRSPTAASASSAAAPTAQVGRQLEVETGAGVVGRGLGLSAAIPATVAGVRTAGCAVATFGAALR
jgi:hypothetical protein